METKLLGAALAVPLVAIGLIANTNSAEAASINGPGTFGLLGSVRVSGNAGDPGVTGDELFTYSFGRSTLIVDTTDGFSEFEGTSGTLQTLVLPPDNVVPGGTTFPVTDFLSLDSNDTFTLTTINAPEFQAITTTQGRPGTVVTFVGDGFFSTESGDTLPGQVVFTSQFTGAPEERIAALVSGQSLSTPYSASFEAVPEPLTIAGAAMALGFGTVFRKKLKNAKKASQFF
ncbi:MAG: PEP-CTERM sorting domain-containing protein [Hydrococcus sp. CRU_1_1]|nr:PEP-CTERM sorting domain-containing protein [Hydrococcus sp. CRU_1_1]